MSGDESGVDELSEKIRRIVAETQRRELSTVALESTFEQLNVDSMDAVNIVFAVENEFDVNVPDDEVRTLHTVSDVVDGVRRLLAQREVAQGSTGS